jgi:predicted dehydrogenase
MFRTLWVIGAGRMAKAYGAVLTAMGFSYEAVCRSPASAEKFTAETGAPARAGGLAAALEAAGAPRRAIVAVAVDQLAPSARALIAAGCRSLLLEKPGGVDADEIAALAALARESGADVRVAYNRRFYESVRAAERILAAEGGPVSMSFEFTEMADVVASLPYAPRVKENWLIANSTHVIDTAFFLAGDAEHFMPFTAGTIAWHSRAARFAGAGRTKSGALFSYGADWAAPGRWGIEVNTTKTRLILRPMEKLQIQKHGSFSIEPVEPLDDLDQRFKPGLYAQTRAFLDGSEPNRLLSIARHAARARAIYEPMLTSGTMVEV